MQVLLLSNNQVRYAYRAGGCVDFRLSLLCEVGEPYQPAARAKLRELERQGYLFDFGVELECKPYMSDMWRRKNGG